MKRALPWFLAALVLGVLGVLGMAGAIGLTVVDLLNSAKPVPLDAPFCLPREGLPESVPLLVRDYPGSLDHAAAFTGTTVTLGSGEPAALTPNTGMTLSLGDDRFRSYATVSLEGVADASEVCIDITAVRSSLQPGDVVVMTADPLRGVLTALIGGCTSMLLFVGGATFCVIRGATAGKRAAKAETA